MGRDGYDAVVVGAGVFGAWIANALARSGAGVALVDAHSPAHARSSSGGRTRVLRVAYGDHEIYSRWAIQSLRMWEDLLARVGRPELFHRSGVLWMAREGESRADQSVRMLRGLGVRHERLTPPEMAARWPQFVFDGIAWGLLEPDSGFLMAFRSVQEVVREAQQFGAALLHEESEPPGGSGTGRLRALRMRSGRAIHADRFVFACGPWLPALFPSLLAGRIVATRQEVFYLGTPPGDARFRPEAMPVWLDMAEEIYGLPDAEGRGLKIALDTHGPPADPDRMERFVTPEAADRLRAYAARRLPALGGAPVVDAEVCQYENTCNGDFLIDRHPDHDNVWLVGGGSGHGFKHGPAIGDYVAGRMADGAGPDPIFGLPSKLTVHRRAVF